MDFQLVEGLVAEPVYLVRLLHLNTFWNRSSIYNIVHNYFKTSESFFNYFNYFHYFHYF